MEDGRTADRPGRPAPIGCQDEPSLEDMIRDPVMQAVMARDGVAPGALLALADEVRDRLAGRRDARVRVAG